MQLTKLFLNAGLLDQQQIDLARQAASDGRRLDEAAVQLGFITEEQSLRAIGDALGLPFVDVHPHTVSLDTIGRLTTGATGRRAWLSTAADYPSFRFTHSWGLGVLGYGRKMPAPVRRFFEQGVADPDEMRRIFEFLAWDMDRERKFAADPKLGGQS